MCFFSSRRYFCCNFCDHAPCHAGYYPAQAGTCNGKELGLFNHVAQAASLMLCALQWVNHFFVKDSWRWNKQMAKCLEWCLLCPRINIWVLQWGLLEHNRGSSYFAPACFTLHPEPIPRIDAAGFSSFSACSVRIRFALVFALNSTTVLLHFFLNLVISLKFLCVWYTLDLCVHTNTDI